jgi:DNA-binding transcriptional ArsR family regulator
MITIPLTTEDLTKVRLSPSPLWEMVTSFGVLLHHGRETVHAPWVARAGRALPGTDLSALIAAMCLERHCPDFLTPPPDASVVEPGGRGITLVPSVFVWPRVEVLVQPGYQPTLAYGPRGVANLWTSSTSASIGTPLEAALSAGRAAVLKGLLPVPRTTTELARQLDLAPGAVSAHLSRLKSAGLIEPHRSGKRVYYRLSYAGESLLGIFGETS